MIPEDSMRDRITAELETTRPPLGDLVARSAAEGQRKKRRTRIGTGALSAVGVLAVAGAVAQFAPSSAATAHDAGSGSGAARGAHPTATTPARTPAKTSGGTSSSPETTTSTSPTSPASPTSPSSPTTTRLPVSSIVQHVDPGPVTLAKGFYLSYTTSSMSWWTYEGGMTMQYGGSNTWGSDFVGGGISDRLVTGMYVGDKDIVAASMTVDGKVYPATVVKVNGSHGWCGLYVLRPAGVTSWNTFQINVYDSSGALVATTSSGGITGPPPTGQSTGQPHGTPPYTNIPLGAPFPGATLVPPPGGGK